MKPCFKIKYIDTKNICIHIFEYIINESNKYHGNIEKSSVWEYDLRGWFLWKKVFYPFVYLIVNINLVPHKYGPSWWRHQMETFSANAASAINRHIAEYTYNQKFASYTTVYKQNARFGRGTHTSGGNAQFVRWATHASRVKYATCRTKWLATGGLKRNQLF